MLKPELRGPYISFEEAGVKVTRYSKEEKEVLHKETWDLFLRSNEDLYETKKQLEDFKPKRIPTVTRSDGDCLFESILSQIQHPVDYTPRMLRRQAAMYMLKDPDFFKPYVEMVCSSKEIDQEGVHHKFESYVTNLFKGTLWGDNLVCGAISKMFGVHISIVSPKFKEPLPIYHNTKKPHIVVCVNGDYSTENALTHYFGSSKLKSHLIYK